MVARPHRLRFLVVVPIHQRVSGSQAEARVPDIVLKLLQETGDAEGRI